MAKQIIVERISRQRMALDNIPKVGAFIYFDNGRDELVSDGRFPKTNPKELITLRVNESGYERPHYQITEGVVDFTTPTQIEKLSRKDIFEGELRLLEGVD